MRLSGKDRAFTLTELAIGIALIVIISVPLVMTLRSGIDLYLKTEANAEVVDGVRFTLDSFGRKIAPMLNETHDIKILENPVIPNPVPKNQNYVYLLGGSLIHRDSSGDHVLDGSDHIGSVSFVLPKSAVSTPGNFMLSMSLNGSYKDAKLSASVSEPLYNTPVKDGNIVSDDYSGNVIAFKTPGAIEMSVSIDLYDKESMVKINNSLMPKGTVILASYDLGVKRDGISIPYEDESSLDWYISENSGIQPDDAEINKDLFLLVDSAGNPETTKTFDTKGDAAGDFYIRTGTSSRTKWKDGGYGVIRCRLTPSVKTMGKTETTFPLWSGYVEIKNKTFWDTWLDAIKRKENIDGFFITNVGEEANFVTLEANTETEQLAIGIKKAKRIKATSGAFTVARLDYRYFDNERLYSIWENRKDKTTDPIPAIMTVTNYSLLINMKMNQVVLFGITVSDTPNTSGGYVDKNSPSFNDLGYSVIMSSVPPDDKKIQHGIFVHPHDGSSTSDQGNSDVLELKGITNVFDSENAPKKADDCYHPLHVQNSAFTYPSSDWWKGNHRVLYTVLEYYDASDTYKLPKYIIRVRFLKPLSDASVKDRLSEIKLTDPWFMGPEFYASEPMWFGDFTGSKATGGTKVAVRRYASESDTTVTASSSLSDSDKSAFYGLNYADSVTAIFKAKVLDLKTDASANDGSDACQRLKTKSRDRYIGMQVYTDKDDAAVDIYAIDLVPGFTADEIRSILPANAKLYEISETVPSDRVPSADLSWYKAGSPARNYNTAVFGASGKSDGSGNNGSRYSPPGIIGLQHIKDSCVCPLENELFRWLRNLSAEHIKP